jgi:hypothetical protein
MSSVYFDVFIRKTSLQRFCQKTHIMFGPLLRDEVLPRTVGDRLTSDVIQKYIVSHRELEHGPAQLALKLRS